MSGNKVNEIEKTYGEILDVTRKSFENGVKILESVRAQAEKNLDFASRTATELQEANRALATQWLGQLERARQGYQDAFKTGLSFWGQQSSAS